MILVSTSKRLTDVLRPLLCRQDALGLNDAVFVMHPHGFNRIQQRTLRGQETHDQAHPRALAFDPLVIGAQPRVHSGPEMPRGIVDFGGNEFVAQFGAIGAEFEVGLALRQRV